MKTSVPLWTCTAPVPVSVDWIVAEPALIVRLIVPVLVRIWEVPKIPWSFWMSQVPELLIEPPTPIDM